MKREISILFNHVNLGVVIMLSLNNNPPAVANNFIYRDDVNMAGNF